MKFTTSLKKNFEFKSVYTKGKSIANKTLVMYVLKNMSNENHIGLSVSKKVGKSVVRSRISRLIKESYRLSEEGLKQGFDIVVIARVTSKDSSYKEIYSAINHLFKKHDLRL